MMRKTFVFDTNALISAFLVKDSVSNRAFRKAAEDDILAMSDSLMAEFVEVLWRPKFDRYFSESERLEVINEVEKYAVPFRITTHVKASPVTDDDKVLELALTAGASCIVSGDPHLLTLHPFRGVPIVLPAEFLKMY